MRRIALLAALVTSAVVVGGQLASGHSLPSARRCPIFPANNQWNMRVDNLPAASNSSTLVRTIGSDNGVHADFGSGNYGGGPIGIPYTTVSSHQPKVRVKFDYSDESNRGPYPIPRNVPIEGGRNADGDRHAIIVDRTRCRLYELYALHPPANGHGWTAGSGAIWSLKSNRLRPSGWTSADAAGLPILPGLARYDEVKKGSIDHALRFTAPRTRDAFIYPARHAASNSNDPSLPAMGQRFRLKKSFDTSHYPRQARVVLEALKKYGMILADNGGNNYISGAPDPRWNMDALRQLTRVKTKDLEVVEMKDIVVDRRR